MKLNLEKAQAFFTSEKFRLIKRTFDREGLAEELRLLASAASLQASGNRQDLVRILDLVIDDEDDLKKIYEILLQGYLFCGYPKAIESFFCLEEALVKKDGLDTGIFSPRLLEDSGRLLEKGHAIARMVHSDKFEAIHNKISAFCPDLGYLMIAEGYGHILSRGGLDIRARELAVVSSLTAQADYRQLNSHIRGSRNVGCDDTEIYETIFTGVLWIPPERVEKSLGLWSKITGGIPSDSVDDYIY